MNYSMKNMSDDFRNAVSSFLQSQNWADVANKIANQELDKDYMVQRFSDGITNEDMQYVINKLTEQKANIKGAAKKGRVQYVINKVKAALQQNISIGSEGGAVKITPSGLAPIGTTPKTGAATFIETLTNLFSGSSEGTSQADKDIKPSGTAGIDIPTQDTTKTNWALIGGIVGGVVVLGTIGYFVFRNKN